MVSLKSLNQLVDANHLQVVTKIRKRIEPPLQAVAMMLHGRIDGRRRVGLLVHAEVIRFPIYNMVPPFVFKDEIDVARQNAAAWLESQPGPCRRRELRRREQSRAGGTPRATAPPGPIPMRRRAGFPSR